MTKMLVEYLEKDVMVFRVYGFADVKPKSKNNAKKPVTAAKKTNPNNSYLGDQSTDMSLDTSLTSAGKVANAVTVQPTTAAISGGMRAAPVVNDPLAA